MMRTPIGKLGYVAECRVSSYFISTTLRELNRGYPCVTFNQYQLNRIKELVPNLVIVSQEEWYTIIKKGGTNHAIPGLQ